MWTVSCRNKRQCSHPVCVIRCGLMSFHLILKGQTAAWRSSSQHHYTKKSAVKDSSVQLPRKSNQNNSGKMLLRLAECLCPVCILNIKLAAGYLSLAWRLEIGETATAWLYLNIKQLRYQLAGQHLYLTSASLFQQACTEVSFSSRLTTLLASSTGLQQC